MSLAARLADYRLAALLFAATIATLAAMQALFPAALAEPIAGANMRSPVMAFEFATRPEQLTPIFGAADDPQRAARIAAMDAGNRLDFVLMPLYGFFVFGFLAAAGRELGSGRWAAIGALGLVAAAADAVENTQLLAITANLADPASELAILPYAVWTKFGLLALTVGAAGVALFKLKRRLLALACLPAPLLFVPGLLAPWTLGSLATALIGLGWIGMGIHAIHRALRPNAQPM